MILNKKWNFQFTSCTKLFFSFQSMIWKHTFSGRANGVKASFKRYHHHKEKINVENDQTWYIHKFNSLSPIKVAHLFLLNSDHSLACQILIQWWEHYHNIWNSPPNSSKDNQNLVLVILTIHIPIFTELPWLQS